MLLTPKTVVTEKERLYTLQKGICPLCNRPLNIDIKSNHLDHDHELHKENAGRVRGLLCGLCNTLEGMMKHKFNRSGLKSEVDYLEWLNQLHNYLSTDHTANPLHPKYVPDKVKWFSRLNKDEMLCELATFNDQDHMKQSKAQLIASYRKLLRQSLK